MKNLIFVGEHRFLPNIYDFLSVILNFKDNNL